MKLIVGLGNPGRKYTCNRHNVGFRCLSYFAKLHSIGFERRECHARTGMGKIAGKGLLLAKPITFVNLSGKAVGCLMHKHDVAPSDLLVICDDLDLPLGKIRLRASGGSGGQKGMNSIVSALGSTDFPRIRVGIGRPQVAGVPSTDEDIIVNHVLSDFSPQEEEAVKLAVVGVAEAVDCFLAQGIEAAMSKFN